MGSTCLVIDTGSPFGPITRSALGGVFDRVLHATGDGALADHGHASDDRLAFEPGDPAGWDALGEAVLARFGKLDAVVLCAPPVGSHGTAAIRTQWLALRCALRLVREGQGGIYLSQQLAPILAMPERAAVLEASRRSMDAGIIDGIALGVRLRANRLVIDEEAAPGAIAEAVRFLCDPRSSFLCGAEIALDAAASAGEATLAGRTVLITGATSGLGRASAIAAGRLGAFVAVGGRKVDLAQETLGMVREAGGDGMVVPLDVTQQEGWRGAIAAIERQAGALHGLVNNAGESVNRRIDQLDPATLNFLLAVNYTGTVLGINAALPLMRRSGGGAVINISSVAGIRAGPGGSAYSAAKAAVVGLSRAWAAQLAQECPVPATGRVRVNAVQPGLIWSDSVAASLGEAGAAAFRAKIEPQTPLGRVTHPAEVAEPVCWLLSDAAAPVTGQAIAVSGGLELTFP